MDSIIAFIESLAVVVPLGLYLRHLPSVRRRVPPELLVAFLVLCSALYAMQRTASKQREADERQATASMIRDLQREISAAFGKVELETEASPLPSAKAIELASLIGPSDGAFARALKATVEGRYEDARRLFSEAEPNSNDLGSLYISRGDMEGYAGARREQLKWYQKALALSPDNTDVLIRIGGAQMAMEKLGEAEASLRHAVSSSSDQSLAALAQSNLACAYFLEGDYEKAKVTNDQALQVFERQGSGYIGNTLANQASIEGALGRPQQAEEDFNRALSHQKKSCPDGADRAATLERLGVFYITRRNYPEAENVLTESVSLRQECIGDGPKLAESWSSLGWLYSDWKRPAEAESAFKKALSLVEHSAGPERIVVLEGYRDFLRTLGREGEAERVDSQLIAIRQNAPIRSTPFLLPTPVTAG
jgi:tetratricopeptide (TPR) repeat protein